jgi:glycosyltransferase involved in cell wall biosynthesis
MKLVYLVNSISKTSIPWRWAEYFNKNSSLINIDLKKAKNIFPLDSSIDIIHGHHIKAMVIFLVLNIFYKKKTVYTVHGSFLFLSKTNKVLLKFIFKYSDAIAFVNKKLYDVLPYDMKKLVNNKYEIILNGVETNYQYIKSDVYKKFNINDNDTIIFHPARFVVEKNHLRIISAVKLLIEKNHNIKLILAGDGKLKQDIKEHINNLDLSNNVKMLGLIERDEVYNFLEKCDLFLMPSISEGLNIAFLEAISMHNRVLVSDIEQFVYPVKSYGITPKDINVKFVNPLDENEIANGIEELLKQEKNYSYDCSDFSLETMMHKYESFYKDIIK